MAHQGAAAAAVGSARGRCRSPADKARAALAVCSQLTGCCHQLQGDSCSSARPGQGTPETTSFQTGPAAKPGLSICQDRGCHLLQAQVYRGNLGGRHRTCALCPVSTCVLHDDRQFLLQLTYGLNLQCYFQFSWFFVFNCCPVLIKRLGLLCSD